jgi:hypothetical protein
VLIQWDTGPPQEDRFIPTQLPHLGAAERNDSRFTARLQRSVQSHPKALSSLPGAYGIPSPHQPVLEALKQSQRVLGRRRSRALGNLVRYCTYERQMEVKINDA